MPSSGGHFVVMHGSGPLGYSLLKALSVKFDGVDIVVLVDEERDVEALSSVEGVEVLVRGIADMEVVLTGAQAVVLNPLEEKEEEGVESLLTVGEILSTTDCFVILLSSFLAADSETKWGDMFKKTEDTVKAWGERYAILRLPLLMENIWIFKVGKLYLSMCQNSKEMAAAYFGGNFDSLCLSRMISFQSLKSALPWIPRRDIREFWSMMYQKRRWLY